MSRKPTLTDDERKRLKRQIKSTYSYGKFTKSKEMTMTDVAEALVKAYDVINNYKLALKKACKEIDEKYFNITKSRTKETEETQMIDYEYDLTKFINKQLSKGNTIKTISFNSRGAWEGCTGEIEFNDGIHIYISDEVHIFDKNDKEITRG